MKNIKFTSHMLHLFFRALCWLTPAVTAYLIFFHLEAILNWGAWNAIILPAHVDSHPVFPYTIYQRFLILLIQLIPLSITILIWNKLAALFYLFEKGSLFEESNIKLIKSIGIYMLLEQVVQLIYQPLMTAALSFNNPIGERVASITMGKTNASALLTAFIIIVASWIIKEAHQLKMDAQLTI